MILRSVIQAGCCWWGWSWYISIFLIVQKWNPKIHQSHRTVWHWLPWSLATLRLPFSPWMEGTPIASIADGVERWDEWRWVTWRMKSLVICWLLQLEGLVLSRCFKHVCRSWETFRSVVQMDFLAKPWFPHRVYFWRLEPLFKRVPGGFWKPLGSVGGHSLLEALGMYNFKTILQATWSDFWLFSSNQPAATSDLKVELC